MGLNDWNKDKKDLSENLLKEELRKIAKKI